MPSSRPLVRARRDRLAVASRRAWGLTTGEIARLERVSEWEVIQTLSDAETERVAEVLTRLRQQPDPERVAKVGALALDLIELRLVAGDVRVAIWVHDCMLRGRLPHVSLAEAMLAAALRQGLATRPWQRTRLGLRLQETWLPDDPRLPPAEPADDAAPSAPAATLPVLADAQSPEAPEQPAAFGADPAQAAAQAEREAGRSAQLIARTKARLARDLAQEELRVETAPPAVPAFMESAADRRRAQARLKARERKARQEEERRKRELACGRALGRVDRGRQALRAFAVSAAVEARMTLLFLHGRPDSPTAQAAAKLHFWPRPPPFRLSG